MAKIVFYEDPSCLVNTEQKAMLTNAGHEIEIHDLMAEPWSPPSLRPFFAARPVAEWFNMSNPRVRSGEINPSEINPQAALVAMMMDPGLIRGPLIRCGNRCSAGFDNLVMNKWVGATAAV